MSDPRPPDEVLRYYSRGGESGRLEAEVREAGFAVAGVFAVEGPGALVPDFARRWADPAARERLLDLARLVESEPSLLGATPHLLAVGRR